MPRAGEDFGGYVLDKTLGRGGSATVYLAHRVADGLPVALKVLDEEHRTDEQKAGLLHGFALVNRLDHPHVIRAFELGDYWLAVGYIDGGDATGLPTRATRFSALEQIADALDYIHRNGIVHCDVKPANILVHADFDRGGAVLIDFNVAHSMAEDMAQRLALDATPRMSLDPAKRITHHSARRPALVQASLPYSSPEVLQGRMPSPASDEYSLACTAVELVTGLPPFDETTAGGLIDAHLSQHPPRLSRRVPWIPRATDLIIAKALAKDPDERYDSCERFVEVFTRSLR